MKKDREYVQKLTSLPLRLIDEVPDTDRGKRFLSALKKCLFPSVEVPKEEDRKYFWQCIEQELAELLRPVSTTAMEVCETTADFLHNVPELYERILEDAHMLLRFDPAARSLGEVIHYYPGFHAIFVYRFAHQLYEQNVPVLPRMLAEIAHTETGIDIHPGANIGRSFFIDHGTGIVIGETTDIGERVRIYQGVTLGALTVRKEDARIKRHPTIEDDVVLYAGSTILGGKTVIAHSSVVGGNVWLTHSVPAYSRVYHTSRVEIRNAQEAALGFQI